MSFILEKDLLTAVLSKVIGITEKRSSMPILSNVLFNFKEENVDIVATDLEISVISKVSVTTPFKGKLLLPGRRLFDVLKELDEGEIEFEIEENSLRIRQKNTEITMALQDPEEFPEIKGNEKITFEIEGERLIRLIEKVAFAISQDETRYVLTGMYMEGKDGRITVCGTDGFRMAIYEEECGNMVDFQGIIIPKRAVVEIEKLFKEREEKVSFLVEKEKLELRRQGIRFITRLIDEAYPDYRSVIPESERFLEIDRERFLKGLRKVGSIGGKNEPVNLRVSDGNMELSVESEFGRAKEMIEIDYGGEEISLNFNIKFLIEALSHMEGKEIVMGFISDVRPVLLEEKGDRAYRNIIMPMRV